MHVCKKCSKLYTYLRSYEDHVRTCQASTDKKKHSASSSLLHTVLDIKKKGKDRKKKCKTDKLLKVKCVTLQKKEKNSNAKPLVDLLTSQNLTKNLLKDQTNASLVQKNEHTDAVKCIHDNKENLPSYAEYHKLMLQIRNPKLRQASHRLTTFQSFPSSSLEKRRSLSNAGFYYEGIGDKVRCFCCDGGFEMWKDDDDPWIEHAKWYPGCKFIKKLKGRSFVKMCHSMLSSEEKQQAQRLIYKNSGTLFLC